SDQPQEPVPNPCREGPGAGPALRQAAAVAHHDQSGNRCRDTTILCRTGLFRTAQGGGVLLLSGNDAGPRFGDGQTTPGSSGPSVPQPRRSRRNADGPEKKRSARPAAPPRDSPLVLFPGGQSTRESGRSSLHWPAPLAALRGVVENCAQAGTEGPSGQSRVG